jgi:hypothetical protein
LVLKSTIHCQIEQPPTGIIGATHRARLNCPETAERGGATQEWHIRTCLPETLKMLVNVTKQNGPQGEMGTQHLLKRGLVAQANRVHTGITNGDRWMVKGDHQRQITALQTLQTLRQPLELERAELTAGRSNLMAVQQYQPHPSDHKISGARNACPPQHRIQQQRVIVVTGQKSDLAAHMSGQRPSQPDIATPAFVLAKVTRDQHQIRVHGAANLESSLKMSKGQPSPHQPLISRHQVWITELKNPHGPQEWTASRCSNGLNP